MLRGAEAQSRQVDDATRSKHPSRAKVRSAAIVAPDGHPQARSAPARIAAMPTTIRTRSSPAKAGRSSRSPSSSSLLLTAGLRGSLAVLAWLVVVFIVQFFRDPPRDDPRADAMPCCRRPTAGSWSVGQGARSVSRPRRAQDQRVHERVQRALEPQPGRRHRGRTAGITPAASSTRRSTRRRSRTSATRCICAPPTGTT